MVDKRYYGKMTVQQAGGPDLWVFYVTATPEDVNGAVILELPGSLSQPEAERVRKALEDAWRYGRVNVAEEIMSLTQGITARGGRHE